MIKSVKAIFSCCIICGCWLYLSYWNMSIKGKFLLWVFRKLILVRKDMDVDEHERLINFTLSKAQMFCTSLFVLLYFFFRSLGCLSFDLQIFIDPLVSSFILVFHNEHNTDHKMSVKRLLVNSWAVLCTSVDKRNIWACLSFRCVFGVNKEMQCRLKTKYPNSKQRLNSNGWKYTQPQQWEPFLSSASNFYSRKWQR